MLELDLQRIRRKWIRRTNSAPIYGILGDGNGNVYTGEMGVLYVRLKQATGYSSYRKLRLDTNANLPIQNNLPVVLGYDHRDELVILKADGVAMSRQGQDSLATNPHEPSLRFVGQQSIVTALSTPNNPLGMSVLANAWMFFRNGQAQMFTGEAKNLSSYLPSSGQHRLALLSVKTDLTLEVTTSTAKSELSPLVLPAAITVDVQECLSGCSAGATPIWIWKLRGGMGTITDTDSFLDCRQLINVGRGELSTLHTPRIVTAAGAVTATIYDDVIVVNKTSGAATTVNLPATPVTGLTLIIKDGKFDAATNNITLDPDDSNTIDGSSTYVMSTNGQCVTVMWNGTQWNRLG